MTTRACVGVWNRQCACACGVCSLTHPHAQSSLVPQPSGVSVHCPLPRFPHACYRCVFRFTNRECAIRRALLSLRRQQKAPSSNAAVELMETTRLARTPEANRRGPTGKAAALICAFPPYVCVSPFHALPRASSVDVRVHSYAPSHCNIRNASPESKHSTSSPPVKSHMNARTRESISRSTPQRENSCAAYDRNLDFRSPMHVQSIDR